MARTGRSRHVGAVCPAVAPDSTLPPEFRMSVRRTPRLPSFLLVLPLLAGLAACKPSPPSVPDASAPAAATPDAQATDAAGAGTAADTVADAMAAMSPATTPKEALRASMQRFMGVRSYHASMQLDGGPRGAMRNEVDFVAPDRFRMAMQGMGTQTIIGDTMYMSVDGRSMKVPLPAGTLTQWRDPARLDENAATMTVEAQGRDNVDGMPARKYLVHNTRPQPSDVTMWIGNDDLPLQIRVSGSAQGRTTTTTIRYSRFDDPTLRIDPPQ
jgi:hypothetical protein